MIKLENITQIYDKNNKLALDNVSLKLPQKGLVILKGRSGSGKSTLLNILAGYLKPTSGEVIGITSNDVSMMFQDYKLVEYLTVYENLRLICDLYQIPYEYINDILKKLEIESIREHFPNQISLGECLRVSLARTILQNKPVVLVDEPTKSIDDENVVTIYNLLKEVARDHLVIVVSHDSYFFDESKNDTLIELENGKIRKNTNLNLEEYDLYKSKPAILKPPSLIWLSMKIVSKSIKRYILLAISLVVTFAVLLTSLTGTFNSRADIVVSNAKHEGIERIPFVQKASIKASIVNDNAMEREKYYHYADRKSVTPYTYQNVNIEGDYDQYNIYFTNYFENWYLNDGEILLSKQIAKDKYKENDTIEINKKHFVIKGIYQESTDDEMYTPSFAVTSNDLKAILYNPSSFTIVSCVVSNTDYHIKIKNGSIEEYDNVLYGQETTLKGNEVALNENYAKTFTNNVESLINQNISIEFFVKQNSLFNSKIECKTYQFTVKYIYKSVMSDYRLLASNEMTSDLICVYSTSRNYAGAYRLSVSIKDKGLINKLYDDNMIDVMPWSGEIDVAIEWARTLNYILLAASAFALLVLILFMSIFLQTSLEKDKTTMGILASLGISKKKIVSAYTLPTMLIIFMSFVLAFILQFPLVSGLNGIVTSINKIDFSVYIFDAVPTIILLVLCILMFPCVSYKMRRTIHRKNIVDIIYNR